MTYTVLVTGATRGLGLATAGALAAGGARVLCAGRTARSAQAAAELVGGEPIALDLASLAGVREAAARLPRVDAVACNAGLQHLGATPATADRLEETFQVNHAGHLVLADELLRRPEPPRRLVFVGSATHDPAIRTGTPDPLDGDVEAMSRAQDDGMRSYTTSKLLAIATAAGLARERPDTEVFAFDPGLMPGTGLARRRGWAVRLLWNTALKGLRVLPFASSPAASGRALAELLAASPPPAPSGSYLDFRLRPLTPSERARDRDFQDAVLRDTRRLAAA